MSHRIRSIAIALAALIAAAATVVASVPAFAGDGRHAPRNNLISSKTAHKVATFMADQYLVDLFPSGKVVIGRCVDGDPIWHCPMVLTAKDTRCTANVWVWSTNAEKQVYWAEIHRMRCA